MGSTAWVLDFGADLRAAVSEREMLHLVSEPELYEIPATPLHCRQVVIWNQEILPVVNLADWLRGRRGGQAASFLGIFGYQDGPGTAPRQGALILRAIPQRVSVSDDQASDLPDTPRLWDKVALACFENEAGSRIPIIDLAKVFSRDLCEVQEASWS